MPRCINWASQHGQKTRNNFLADHFSFLLLPCRVRCPKVAKNGLLERWRALMFSIAIAGHLGAPSSQRPSKAARTPIEHDERSSSMWRSANPSKGAKVSITRSTIPPPVSRAVQCRRSDRTAKNGESLMFDDPPQGGRWRSEKALSSAPRAHFWRLLGA